MIKEFKDTFGRTIINKSKLDFCKDSDYWKNSYDCELCGTTYNFDEMSTCERCLRFVCDDCSEAVCNRENNPFKEWDFLCNDCIKELDNMKTKKVTNKGDIEMSNIEKMYENAGIVPKKNCYYWDCPYSTGMPANDIPYAERNCQDCNNPDKAVYPPFTAEKQIEILKFLFAKDVFKCYQHYTSKAYIVLTDDVKDFICNKPFDEFLASYINYLWLSLTDKEKQQVKDILSR